MKSALLTIVFVMICGVSAFGQAGWTVENSGAKGDLITVFFTGSDRGWIAGDDGYLAGTTDGGRSWTAYPLGMTEGINEIYFRNDDNGYLVAGRRMFATKDKGKTWQDLRTFRSGDFGAGRPDFLSIRFSDKNKGYLIGSVLKISGGEEVVVDSLLMRTDDGGETWRRITVPTKTELYHLDFTGNSHGWVVGDNGVILHTDDEGRTWRQQTSGTTMPLYNVHFRDKKEGYAVGKSGTILRTDDGGTTWIQVSTNFKDTFMRVDFADDKNGWTVGYDGLILRSSDKGRSWVRQESNTAGRLYGLYMHKNFGWAVGENGLVLRFRK